MNTSLAPQDLRVFTIHSFPAHGTAGLKVSLNLLGSRVIPVPSLYLSGLTNMEGVQKFPVPFREMLWSSLDLARRQKLRLLLYAGYLGEAQQAHDLLEALDAFEDLIEAVVVDPVSGDHGRRYVPEAVLDVWPLLLQRAHWALPNYTELQLLSDLPLDPSAPAEDYLQAFRNRFPQLSFLVTSYPQPGGIGISLQEGDASWSMGHERLTHHFGGSGDVFTACFIQAKWIAGQSSREAATYAAHQVLELLRQHQQLRLPSIQLAGQLPAMFTS